MQEILISIISLTYFSAIIVLCLKDRFRIITPMILFSFSSYPIILGLIYQYSLTQEIPSTSISPIIPYSIGITTLILAIVSCFIPKKSLDNEFAKKPSIKRWLYFSIGIIFVFMGITSSLMFWYTPHILNKLEPMPLNGVISNILFTFFSALFLYFASRINSRRRPNLMRKVVVLSIFLFIHNIPIVLSLILVYSFPIDPSAIFPFEAGINLTPHLIWAVLLLFIMRESIDKRKPEIN